VSLTIRKAKRQKRPLKIMLEGLSGRGKTYTALRMAFAMRRLGIGKKIVVIDSENKSADLYAGIVEDGEAWDYDVATLPPPDRNPLGYTRAYEAVIEAGFDIIIPDSLTHAWKGALSKVDEVAASHKGDKFGAGWRTVSPELERMFQTLTDDRAHLLATSRVKGDYEVIKSDGRTQIKKVGLKADQRADSEYEFDALVRLDTDDDDPTKVVARVDKIRGCRQMKGRVGANPGPDFWKPLFDWWLSAEDAATPEEEAKKKLDACASLAELVATWGALPEWLQKGLVAVKDKCKAKFAPPAARTPPPASPPQAVAGVDYPAAFEEAADGIPHG
jgi:hypothetical protein